MALNKGIWEPKLRGTNIKGTNLKSLILLGTNSVLIRRTVGGLRAGLGGNE